METIIYHDTDETTLFAVAELRRLMKKATCNSTIYESNKKPLQDSFSIHLLLTADYNALPSIEKKMKLHNDGFAIVNDAQNTWIIGNEPRAVLYGVYEYVKKRFGFKFIQIQEETIVKEQAADIQDIYIHEPTFARRGNVIETINDPEYVRTLIDWGVKNGQNECFFTFFLWDELKPYIATEFKKRDIHITLGGHSLSYLLTQIKADTKQDEKLKFFSENTQLQDQVIDIIVQQCVEESIISRISLWPEDIGIDEKHATGFISTYIRFTERLKEALKKQHLEVEVEHIVYNAGLSWNMLERESDTVASKEVNVLFAYWGRDYSTSIKNSEPAQARAYHSLLDWKEQSKKMGRDMTVFEYYSDHFMLSQLFPPLLNRIQADLTDYETLDVKGVLNLIVPLHKKGMHPNIEDHYPWQWIHHFNNYIYTRMAWGERYESVVDNYFSSFAEKQDMFLRMMTQLESLVSQHTKWNKPLFPARIVDPEKVSSAHDYADVSSYLNRLHDLLSTWDLSQIESLLPIQTSTNDTAFTTKEMTLIYFYYLKQIAYTYDDLWHAKNE